MNFDLTKVQKIISEFTFIKVTKELTRDVDYVKGNIEVSLPKLLSPLEFELQIYPHYPFKMLGNESIRFINTSLVDYSHVMEDGAICIHTWHSYDLRKKLKIDFQSLVNWINKYVILKEVDTHYEHLMLQDRPVDGYHYSFIFSELNNHPEKGEFGSVKLTLLSEAPYKQKSIFNYLIQGFTSNCNIEYKCKWSEAYKSLPASKLKGIFFFTKDPPSIKSNFGIKKWNELESFVSDEFLMYLYKFKQKALEEEQNNIIPLFLGYKLPDSSIHWVVSLISIKDFPLKLEYQQRKLELFLPKYKFDKKNINWGLTRNSSYNNFYGRGRFCDVITKSKILIIGIGAIGSMVAKSLTRGGCRNIDLIDYG